MKWHRINKDPTTFPKNGHYQDWKAPLREEAKYQCVYCCIGEGVFGGYRNFHIEHYKPKSIFEILEHNYGNLFYACCICNVFKGDDWPAEPASDFSNFSYPDPSKVDYSELFEYESTTGYVLGKFTASKYMQERLYLNRPQLVQERRLQTILGKCSSIKEELLKLTGKLVERAKMGDENAADFLGELVKRISNLDTLKTQLINAIPYEHADVSR